MSRTITPTQTLSTEALRAKYTAHYNDAADVIARCGMTLSLGAFKALARQHYKADKYLTEASRWTLAAREAAITVCGIAEGAAEEACDANAEEAEAIHANTLALYRSICEQRFGVSARRRG